MKPPPFRYARPDTVGKATQLLADEEDAKVLAGGQSLVPLLNFRLARPSLLVDVTAIPELGGVRCENGSLVIGATVRQRALERSPVAAAACPLIAKALRHVGHVPTRTRGTIGGSIAHADPAAELPAVALALDATLRVTGSSGTRSVPADSFFRSPYTADLAPDELLVEAQFPTGHWDRTAFVEFGRRSGDFALAGVAALVGFRSQDAHAIDDLRLVGLGVGPTPIRLYDAEDELRGRHADAQVIAAAGRAAAAACRPIDDVHADSSYRRHLLDALVTRALQEVSA